MTEAEQELFKGRNRKATQIVWHQLFGPDKQTVSSISKATMLSKGVVSSALRSLRELGEKYTTISSIMIAHGLMDGSLPHIPRHLQS